MKEYKLYSGFTLIEIIVVLGILVLAYAIVPPMVEGTMGGVKLKSATREISSALRYSRSTAIARQQDMALILNVEKNSYSIDEKTRQLDIPEEAEIKLITAKSEQLSETEGAIRFYPDGSSTGGNITVADRTMEYTIDVNWLTGKIAITP